MDSLISHDVRIPNATSPYKRTSEFNSMDTRVTPDSARANARQQMKKCRQNTRPHAKNDMDMTMDQNPQK